MIVLVCFLGYLLAFNNTRIAVLADIHFDERYTPTGSQDVLCRGNQNKLAAVYSLPGCDTPEALLDLVISSLQAEASYDVIIILGDIGPHSSASLEMTQRAITTTVRKLRVLTSRHPQSGSSPEAQATKSPIVLPVIGNNDVFPAYYVSLTDTDPQIEFIADSFKDFMPSDSYAQFRTKGFYTVSLSKVKIVFIVLNTNYYSIRQNNTGDDPMMQFQWLEEQLKTAESNQHLVILISHIPFGVNSYDDSEALQSRYTRRIRTILRRYAATVLFTLHGHYHSAYPFTLSIGEEPLISMFTCPSIAPSNYNNPAYYIFDISDHHHFDYEHFVLNIESANAQARNAQRDQSLLSFTQLYTFSQRYCPWLGKDSLPTPRNIAFLYRTMQKDDFLWHQVRVAASSMFSEQRLGFLQTAIVTELNEASST